MKLNELLLKIEANGVLTEKEEDFINEVLFSTDDVDVELVNRFNKALGFQFLNAFFSLDGMLGGEIMLDKLDLTVFDILNGGNGELYATNGEVVIKLTEREQELIKNDLILL